MVGRDPGSTASEVINHAPPPINIAAPGPYAFIGSPITKSPSAITGMLMPRSAPRPLVVALSPISWV